MYISAGKYDKGVNSSFNQSQFVSEFSSAFEDAFGFAPSRVKIADLPIIHILDSEIIFYFSGMRLEELHIRFGSSMSDYVPRSDYEKFNRLRALQGWKQGIWDVNVPNTMINSSDIVSNIINELNRLTTFHKYLVPAEDKVKRWPSKNIWYNKSEDQCDFDDMWSEWLSGPEDKINTELQIFPEPSTQGWVGAMFIYDESGEARDENGFPWEEDWGDWYDWQVQAAATSRNAEEYKQKYREHIREICGI